MKNGMKRPMIVESEEWSYKGNTFPKFSGQLAHFNGDHACPRRKLPITLYHWWIRSRFYRVLSECGGLVSAGSKVKTELQDADLRLEYHLDAAAGRREGSAWPGEVQHGHVHGALLADHHRGGRGEGGHIGHGKGRGQPRRFESCCHFLRSRGLILDRSPMLIRGKCGRGWIRDSVKFCITCETRSYTTWNYLTILRGLYRYYKFYYDQQIADFYAK